MDEMESQSINWPEKRENSWHNTGIPQYGLSVKKGSK